MTTQQESGAVLPQGEIPGSAVTTNIVNHGGETVENVPEFIRKVGEAGKVTDAPLTEERVNEIIAQGRHHSPANLNAAPAPLDTATTAPENPARNRRWLIASGVLGGLAAAATTLIIVSNEGASPNTDTKPGAKPSVAGTLSNTSEKAQPNPGNSETFLQPNDPARLSQGFLEKMADDDADTTWKAMDASVKGRPTVWPNLADESTWKSRVVDLYSANFKDQPLLIMNPAEVAAAKLDHASVEARYFITGLDGQNYQISINLIPHAQGWDVTLMNWNVTNAEAPRPAIEPKPIIGTTPEEVVSGLNYNEDCLNRALPTADFQISDAQQACINAIFGLNPPTTIYKNFINIVQLQNEYRRQNDPTWEPVEIIVLKQVIEHTPNKMVLLITDDNRHNNPNGALYTDRITFQQKDGVWTETDLVVLSKA